MALMQIIRSFAAPPKNAPPLSLVVGNFDGVHIGHRYLLERAKHAGGLLAADGLLAAMTFEPHPLAVLRPGKPLFRIGGLREKIRHLADGGVRRLYLLRFDKTLAAVAAEDFAELLFSRLGARRLVVGGNFRFGKGARGDCALLQRTAVRYGASVDAAPLYEWKGKAVSSGRVRELLKLGFFADAAQLLGRDWTLCGRVCRGAGVGRTWGVPTANLRLSFVPPCGGVFAARAQVGGDSYAAAVSIGVNPTVQNDNIVRTEAHLLDFCGDIYGERLTLTLIEKLREEKHFPSIAALREALADDVRRVRLAVGR